MSITNGKLAEIFFCVLYVSCFGFFFSRVSAKMNAFSIYIYSRFPFLGFFVSKKRNTFYPSYISFLSGGISPILTLCCLSKLMVFSGVA